MTDTPAASPEDIVADLDRRATRRESPCGDGALVWRVWGEGPAVVLLHGAHGAWSHWIRNIDALTAAGLQVWAPDLPGHGDSALPDAVDGDSLGAVLAQGLQTLLPAGDQADVVGFSMGGVIAAHLAAVAPALVRRLIIVDAGGLDTPWVTPRVGPIRGLEGEALRAAHRINLLGLMIHDPANCDDLAIHVQALNTPRGRLKAFDLVMPDKLLGVLPRVRAQVDAIWAEHDFPHPDPAAQLDALRAVKPDCEMRVVADAGHWVMYEGAAAFNTALTEMLDQPLRQA